MSFIEGTEVIYKDLSGTIDFVCPSYVVISIASKTATPARLLVYRKYYSDIHCMKHEET